jgi:hypothetical protein
MKNNTVKNAAQKLTHGIGRYAIWAKSRKTRKGKIAACSAPFIGAWLVLSILRAGEPEQSAQIEVANAAPTADQLAIAKEDAAKQSAIRAHEAREVSDKQAETQAAAAGIAKERELYGMTQEEFTNSCKILIEVVSGSDNFGLWNSTPVLTYEKLPSLVLNKSVHGKNAFGVDVEQRYKCWTDASQEVQVELIDVSFE